MPNYYYDRYISVATYSNHRNQTLQSNTTVGPNATFYHGFSHQGFTTLNGFFAGTATLVADATHPAYSATHDSLTTVTWLSGSVGANATYQITVYICDFDTTYSRGSFIDSLILNDTYPADGRHTDGIWYVRGAQVFPLIKVNIGGVWKDANDGSVNIGGVWKGISGMWVNIGGVWKNS